MAQENTDSNYVPEAIFFNRTIRDMRKHVEYEKFLCRMMVDNDDTRKFKENTDNHPDSIHKFIYNNELVEAHTMRGKYEAIGKSAYIPTPKQDDEDEQDTTTTEENTYSVDNDNIVLKGK